MIAPPPAFAPRSSVADVLRMPLWTRLAAFALVLATTPFTWVVFEPDALERAQWGVRTTTGWAVIRPNLGMFVGLHLMICLLGSFPRATTRADRTLRVVGDVVAALLSACSVFMFQLAGPLEQNWHLGTAGRVGQVAMGATLVHAIACALGLGEPRQSA